ncbi:UNVERIFIED_CONTAM: putative late blight resistance proteinR1A-10 [Sesamum radiatum]|uniref:Late blight resistance proteinR1A-10 n=1 Tax=Sesamum radiatum TaxID=300843 RepID=A0AAW2WMB8_SESRA
MAVAAYAALLSLSHVLENVQLPARRSRLHLDTQQLQSPQEKVEFLRDFLELHSQKRSQEMEDLGRQISIVADEAEDIIDFHVVYQLCEGSNDHKSDPVAALSSFCQDIDRVVEKIDSIMKGLMKMEEEWGYVLEQKPVASLLPSSSTPLVSGKNTMLGFDEYLVQIMDELTRDDSDLRILPIVGMGGCPYPELEEIGKSIAKGCNGLPLAIVVIGGLLAKSNMTQEYWEFVIKSLTSFSNSEDDEHCSRVLSLSYNHLPIHLKPCFLYWRVFPEDHQTCPFDLIQLWLAEGFLKPVKGKTLEEVAEQYLKELIDRNLIIVIDQGLSKPPGLVMHDILRDFCLREYRKQHFILVPRIQHVSFDEDWINMCFICRNHSTLESLDLPEVNVTSQSTSLASLLVCWTCKNTYSGLSRLRVVRMKYFENNSCEYLHPTRLRCLKILNRVDMEFTTSYAVILPLLWNLQILNTPFLEVLPSEIWDIPQLRHITSTVLILLYPVVIQDCTILENLQTLTYVQDFKWTDEVIKRIPNIKELYISYSENNVEWSYYCLYNLARLHKLECLKLIADDFLVEHIGFPSSLKKLELSHCRIPWEHMTVIGPEWNPVEGEFLRLEELMIYNSNLVWWRAENIHFPNLKLLRLYSMHKLQEIPLSIGDIDTLQKIELRRCKKSAKDSAKQIAEEQHNNGNESLQVYVDWDKVIVS